jgi:uncharacterized protein YukE
MNQFQCAELEKILQIVFKSAEGVRSSLSQMNEILIDAVGVDGYAWSGEEAIRFKNAWEALAIDIPEYIQIVENQALNIEMVLNKVRETEQK